mmetsp:Transcript_59070/g.97099  ORF Transcript_59070/g.97099 Transcript_59070/m.97099 type:complete len:327 (+) Transcript_59070:778-1758(+)
MPHGRCRGPLPARRLPHHPHAQVWPRQRHRDPHGGRDGQRHRSAAERRQPARRAVGGDAAGGLKLRHRHAHHRPCDRGPPPGHPYGRRRLLRAGRPVPGGDAWDGGARGARQRTAQLHPHQRRRFPCRRRLHRLAPERRVAAAAARAEAQRTRMAAQLLCGRGEGPGVVAGRRRRALRVVRRGAVRVLNAGGLRDCVVHHAAGVLRAAAHAGPAGRPAGAARPAHRPRLLLSGDDDVRCREGVSRLQLPVRVGLLSAAAARSQCRDHTPLPRRHPAVRQHPVRIPDPPRLFRQLRRPRRDQESVGPARGFPCVPGRPPHRTGAGHV